MESLLSAAHLLHTVVPLARSARVSAEPQLLDGFGIRLAFADVRPGAAFDVPTEQAEMD